jgi:heat shock protein HslJ
MRRWFPVFVAVSVAVLSACSSNGSSKASSTTGSTSGSTTGTTSRPAASSTTAAASGALEGPEWALSQADTFAIPAGVGITASFTNGTVSGSSGCNQYHAAYTVTGSQLRIGVPASTLKACVGPALIAEQAYLRALPAVESYTISSGGSLELSTKTAKVLTYARQSQSVAGSWDVIAYLNHAATGFVSVIAGTKVTADFDTAGAVSGSSGCNNYNGPYTAQGSTISIGPLAGTRKLCTEPAGVATQEGDFLAAMEASKSFTVSGTVLTLFDSAGRRTVDMSHAG